MAKINESLKLIIFPTEECNFRCKYCYEQFKIGKMRKSVVLGIKNLITQRSQDLKHLQIGWFGGEPLLAFDIIQDIMDFARKKSNESGFDLTSSMSTNGSLFTPLKQQQLVNLGVTDYQISFDGDSEIHNGLRATRRDTPTFSLIYNNLVKFHKSQLNGSVTIRLHVNKNNYESLRYLIAKMSIDFLGDKRFFLFVRGLEKLGSNNDVTLPIVENKEEEHNLISRMQEYARNLGLSLYGTSSNETPVCYAASFNSFAIRATGEISKCTVALYDKINNIGHLSEDGKLKIDKEKLGYWVRGQFSGNKIELACPYAHQ
ncbi:MAG: radical SAM protein [Candidatus Thermoplasmatota archaeon]|nr:radical SAM protein [Candidatus Thermoplasmatota archaeon]